MGSKQRTEVLHVRCILCGGTASTVGTGEHRTASCPACGFDFVTPPLPDELGIAFQSDGVVIDDSGRTASFDLVEKMLRRRLGGAGTVLDLGCGAGAFMRLLQQEGWDVTGIDINPRAIEIARERGLDARVATLWEVDPPGPGFDAVVVLNALEYFARPIDALRRVGSLVRPRGAVVLETPNTSYHHRQAQVGRLLGTDPARLMTVQPVRPRRLAAFGPRSARLALEQAGFAAVHVQPALPRNEGNLPEQLARRSIFTAAALVYRMSRGRAVISPSMIVDAIRT